MALAIARAPEGRRVPLLLAVLLPFWTGFLIRVGAWIGLLRDEGWINGVLRALGLRGEDPLHLLYTDLAMLLGMVHAYLPFAVLPLAATLARIEPAVEEAAADLGARPGVAFLTVTLPLSAPGAAAAFLLVFIPAAGEFVIPELLGPPEAQLVGRVLWGEFFASRDWPVAAALAVVLLALLLLPIRLFQRLGGGQRA
jgi:putrescine transport system permease protein